MPLRVLLRYHPRRVVALATETHILSFSHSPAPQLTLPVSAASSPRGHQSAGAATPAACLVEFQLIDAVDLQEYRSLTSLAVQGTLGLVTIEDDVFLCLVTGAAKSASIRPGEDIKKITSVEFYCISRPDHDALLDVSDRFGGDSSDDNVLESRPIQPSAAEHPCLPLKKLLSGNSFYYSADFDLTRRLQDRIDLSATVALDSLDGGYLWNAFMIQPLVNFRSRLSADDRQALDASRILTSAIRGFAMTIPVPAAASPVGTGFSGMPSTITLISRLSCRRAGTRFNSRGVDDDGNVANFVETETVFCAPSGLCFSYVQIRGSVTVFWEQAAGFTPAQQKIQLSRSAEATQPAFDRHFAELRKVYGRVHIVNLLSREKAGEIELTNRYHYHVSRSPLNRETLGDKSKDAEHGMLHETDYDFHAETRGQGYEAASGIKQYLRDSAESFEYFLSENGQDSARAGHSEIRAMTILQQEGVFRTNCLDCLDRTNLVQTIISQMALEELLRHRGERRSSNDFLLRHSTLWADNGDALSKIYAGTGALKSSFTRSGKMSFAGALADVRKSATRLYINNFEDKGRQQTIDMLLGRLMGQVPVHLYDPVHDYVTAELHRRRAEYTSTLEIGILVGTFNLNGRIHGLDHDLSPWLRPAINMRQPDIIAVGFQEIVDLSPQQIMSTDPNRRLAWEDALKRTLNGTDKSGAEEYVLLRGGQLVGASLSVYVKRSVLRHIKNVEGSLIKTGLSGMAGNKGAVAIRMEYAQTSICLVTAHLAAGFANYEERNQDYRTISQGLHFQRMRSIEDHDAIVWFGDFNYRIGMSNERVRQLIDAGDLDTLYQNDQLNLQMVHGKTFPHYSEARIRFPPTYKYDAGTDDYDTSPQQRIPAWCDRVLSKGHCLKQMHYDTAPLRFSDHRPVYAGFGCTVSVVDEQIKREISDAVYTKRRAMIGQDLARNVTDLIDAEDSQAEHEYMRGLPPASSDKHKWWLDGGLSARSQVAAADVKARPDGASSNPFKTTPDKGMRDDRTPPGAPPLPARQGSPAATHKRSGPPIPNKPMVLRQRDSSSRRPDSDQSQSRPVSRSADGRPVLRRANSSAPGAASAANGGGQLSASETSAAPTVPPPRRSTIQKRNDQSREQRSKSRTASSAKAEPNLMDDRPGPSLGVAGLASWEPLKPS